MFCVDLPLCPSLVFNMPRKPIYTEVMDVVERRIAEGDYMLKDLPGERRLAEEVGVSYMTARKAVLGLIEKRVLSRRPNGSLAVHPNYQDHHATTQIALLCPAFPSTHFVHCRSAISRAADRQHARVRAVEYTHWHDPSVQEALQGSDGLIIIPSTETIPASTLKTLTAPSQRVVIFDGDLSEYGLPSIQLFPEAHLQMLYETLWAKGYRRIDCLNAQGRNYEIDRRIASWQNWLEDRGGQGTLWDSPAPPYGDPITRAYDSATRLFGEGISLPEALICTTQPAALGAMRAAHEAGLGIGSDLAIATINNEPTGRYFCPSLTGLEMPDIDPLVSRCLHWFADGCQDWSGNLQIVPSRARLFEGESTANALRTTPNAQSMARA